MMMMMMCREEDKRTSYAQGQHDLNYSPRIGPIWLVGGPCREKCAVAMHFALATKGDGWQMRRKMGGW